jgi:endonuclease III
MMFMAEHYINAGIELTEPFGNTAPNMSNPHIARIIQELARLYPDTGAFLRHQKPFHFVWAVILSAQCTDATVNEVTPALFKAYPNLDRMAKAHPRDVEKLVFKTGFYHNKARNLIAFSKALLERHGGKVPETIEELVELPGVGRKTANVVLAHLFGKTEGIVVDTHVIRLSNRLGFTRQKDPAKIEQDLMKAVPKRQWIPFSHRLIQHGRAVCDARKPHCGECTLAKWCPKLFPVRVSLFETGRSRPRPDQRQTP